MKDKDKENKIIKRNNLTPNNEVTDELEKTLNEIGKDVNEGKEDILNKEYKEDINISKADDPIDEIIEDNGWNIDVINENSIDNQESIDKQEEKKTNELLNNYENIVDELSEKDVNKDNDIDNEKLPTSDVDDEIDSSIESENDFNPTVDEDIDSYDSKDELDEEDIDLKSSLETTPYDKYESNNGEIKKMDKLLKKVEENSNTFDNNAISNLDNENKSDISVDPSSNDMNKEKLDETVILNTLNPVDIDLDESKEMKLDESVTEAIFDHPITKSEQKQYFENKNSTVNVPLIDKNVQKVSNELDKNKSKNYKNIIIISVAILIIIAIIVLNFISKNAIFNKEIVNLSTNFGLKSNESANFKLDIETSGNSNYDVIKKANINGSYESTKDTFDMSLDLKSSYDEDVNLYLLTNKDNSYVNINDYNKFIKLNNKYNLSVNNFKENVISLLKQINKVGIINMTCSKNSLLSNELVLNIDNNNLSELINDLSKIKLDDFYNHLLTNLINDMNTNPNNYINSKITLDMDMFGNLKKFEISSKVNVLITKDKNTYKIEYIDKDNNVTNIEINKTNIKITKSVGSTVSLDVNIDMDINYNNSKFKKLELPTLSDNILDLTNMNATDSFQFKKNINSSKTKNALLNLYYSVSGKLNPFNMSVTNDKYYVFYNVPSEYGKTATNTKSLKKYINYDRTLIYSINNYSTEQVIQYVNSEYQKEMASSYYSGVILNDIQTISNNGINYNYIVVTKSYDGNYANNNTTSSTIYIWNQLDVNTSFLIEYEFEGNTITNDNVNKLVDIEVGQ